jgi:hypothetical protein
MGHNWGDIHFNIGNYKFIQHERQSYYLDQQRNLYPQQKKRVEQFHNLLKTDQIMILKIKHA